MTSAKRLADGAGKILLTYKQRLAMTPEHKESVQRTWKLIVPVADTAADLFYDKLFELDCDLQALFEGVDLAAQKKKLLHALATTVGSLNALEDFLPQLSELGRRHAGYGVADAHYDTVGRGLIWTLERGLGEDWTPDVEQAWTAAYAVVAGTMKKGARGDDKSRARPQTEAA